MKNSKSSAELGGLDLKCGGQIREAAVGLRQSEALPGRGRALPLSLVPAYSAPLCEPGATLGPGQTQTPSGISAVSGDRGRSAQGALRAQ